MSDFDFSQDTLPDDNGFDLLKDGNYLCLIESCEVKTTKKKQSGQAQKGRYLALVFQVIDEVGKGRKLWVNLNFENDSVKAENLAKAEIKKIMNATGIQRWTDPSDVINKTLYLVVGIKIDKLDGSQENIVKDYKNVNDVVPF